MADFLLLMHADITDDIASERWTTYFTGLRDAGAFQGGSAIGEGVVLRKSGPAAPVSDHLSGYIRVRAADLAAARALVVGNPVYECGGSVEVRALPLT